MMELRLQNFQAWSAAQMELRGLTTVVGDSSLGKSSFARAIRKALRNELAPGNIKLGAPKASIHFTYKGLDLLVERGAKTKDSTVYTVNGQVYEKLGGDVPQEIKDQSFGPIEVNGTTIDPCFAKQFDGQFLVDAKPAELNAVLNAFASTEKLDRGRKAMSSKITEINAQAKVLAPQISVLEEQAAAVVAQINLVAEPVSRVMVLTEQVGRQQKARGTFKAYMDGWMGVNLAAGHLRGVEAAGAANNRAVTQFKVLSRCATVKTAEEIIQARRLQVQQLSAVDGSTDRPTRVLKATEALRRLLQAQAAIKTTVAQLASLELVTPALNKPLVLHKARVRVKALLETDPEPIRALLRQVHELPVAKPGTILKAAIIMKGLGVTSTKLQGIQTQLDTLNAEATDVKRMLDATEAEIEEARKAAVTCPKCGHEFTPSHSH